MSSQNLEMSIAPILISQINAEKIAIRALLDGLTMDANDRGTVDFEDWVEYFHLHLINQDSQDGN